MPTFLLVEITDPVLLPYVRNFLSMTTPGARELCHVETLACLATEVDLLDLHRTQKVEFVPTGEAIPKVSK